MYAHVTICAYECVSVVISVVIQDTLMANYAMPALIEQDDAEHARVDRICRASRIDDG